MLASQKQTQNQAWPFPTTVPDGAQVFNTDGTPVTPIKPKRDWKPYGSSIMIDVDRNSGDARLNWTGKFLMLMYVLILIPVALFMGGVACVILWAAITTLFS